MPLQDVPATNWQAVGQARSEASAAAHLGHQQYPGARLRCQRGRARGTTLHKLCRVNPLVVRALSFSQLLGILSMESAGEAHQHREDGHSLVRPRACASLVRHVPRESAREVAMPQR